MTHLFSGLCLMLAVCLAFSAGYVPPVEEPAPALPLLELYQLDVDVADAYVIRVEDLVIFVDCGLASPDTIFRPNQRLFRYLESMGIDHMDVHFVTHWHNDHCFNTKYFSEVYATDETVVYGPSESIPSAWSPLAHGTYRQLKEGDELEIGGLHFLCVGPPPNENGTPMTGGVNSESLNLVMTYGSHRFMFTGDCVRNTVLKNWPEEIRNIDVFSFPHHGLEPIEINLATYRWINPRLVLVPGAGAGIARVFGYSRCGTSRDAVYLSLTNGHVLVTSDGTHLTWAVSPDPASFPEGEPVPVISDPKEIP